jgi:hypothetical protein
MPELRMKLTEEESNKLNIYKALKKLSSKEAAIKQLIKDLEVPKEVKQ